MGLGAKGFEVGFVPESPDILWAIKLLDHGKEQVVEFTAPTEPGDYPYICTFPGHHMMMRGTLIAANSAAEAADILKKNPELTVKITPWKVDDLAPDLSRVGMHRNFAGAKVLFNALGCAQCPIRSARRATPSARKSARW